MPGMQLLNRAISASTGASAFNFGQMPKALQYNQSPGFFPNGPMVGSIAGESNSNAFSTLSSGKGGMKLTFSKNTPSLPSLATPEFSKDQTSVAQSTTSGTQISMKSMAKQPSAAVVNQSEQL